MTACADPLGSQACAAVKVGSPCAQVTHPAKDAEGIKDAPQEGVFVHGLFLDGCAWSNRENRLVDSEPKKLFHALPVLYITGVLVRRVSTIAAGLDSSY